ncbi:ParM/StbA family protein [Paenibacillus sp. FSL L8-0435]|uniref:ParM/StbA family protein n=1 Tax=Paenibacillus sp. FSL L8-0435 TaxID=2954618 RepID=UPI0030D84994
MSSILTEDISVFDLGFSWAKGKKNNKLFIQPSIAGESQPMFDTNIKPNDFFFEDTMFVGDLALRQSEIKYFTLNKRKSEAMTSEVILKTGLGYLNGSKKFNLVTGLPILFYFKQMSEMEDMINRLAESDPYEIKKGRGNFSKVKLNIDKYKIVPQGYGIAMNHLLNKSGKIQNKTDAKKKILVVDLGFYTLNLLGLDGLEIMKESTSLFLGVEKAYKLLRKYLQDLVGTAPAIYELDKYVLSGTYEGHDIRHLVSKAFKALAIQIQNEIEGLNINFDMYMIGGGAARYIFEYLRLNNKSLYGQLDQVEGNEKVGVRLWGSNTLLRA